jgi:hypothetical protein
MEKLANMEAPHPNAFKVSHFLDKIKHAWAGFVRSVAICEE